MEEFLGISDNRDYRNREWWSLRVVRQHRDAGRQHGLDIIEREAASGCRAAVHPDVHQMVVLWQLELLQRRQKKRAAKVSELREPARTALARAPLMASTNRPAQAVSEHLQSAYALLSLLHGSKLHRKPN